MNKRFIGLILAFLVVLVTNGYAWGWDAHQMFVEKLYSDMPRELQVKLNLTLMEEGSIAPDKILHNNVLHHYPPTYILTLQALNEAGDWNNISYNFGIAAHYISDSFAAPHNIARESSKLHSEFEKQVENYISNVDCADYNLDLKQGLENASLNYRDWGEWILTKDKTIPEKEVDSAMTLIYSVAFDEFDFKCNKKTNVEYAEDIFNLDSIMKFFKLFFWVLFAYIFYRIIKRFKYKK